MEKHTQRIKGFSRVMYILLQITFWLLIAASIFIALAYILELAKPNISVNLPGVTIAIPEGQQVGNTRIILPEFEFAGYGLRFMVGVRTVFGIAAALVALAFAMRIFSLLRRDGIPFLKEIANGLKNLAIALLVAGIFSGIVGFIAAAVTAALCLIFEYGIALQDGNEPKL